MRIEAETLRISAKAGSIRSFVFRAGFVFFVWLRFCQGAVAPSSWRYRCAPALQLICNQ